MKYVKVFIVLFIVVCCLIVAREIYWARATLVIPLSEADLTEKIKDDDFLVIVHDATRDLGQDIPDLRSALAAARTKVYSFGLTDESDEIKEILYSMNMVTSLPVICVFSRGTLQAQYYKSVGALDKDMLISIFEAFKQFSSNPDSLF